MAYGNNAVEVTIDSYLSENIEYENNENNKNNKNNGINGNNGNNGHNEINKNNINNGNIGDNEEIMSYKDDNNNDSENDSISHFNQRTAAYDNWLAVPDTP